MFLDNLSSPPLLFFFLGVVAVLVRSDLDVPGQIAKFLSLYLLFAIGFKGGVALAESELDSTVWLTLLAAMGLSAAVPLYTFFALRRRFTAADAAATAATYGSVSAVTFITATGYLTAQDVSWNGYMVAAMALMESPAIIVGMKPGFPNTALNAVNQIASSLAAPAWSALPMRWPRFCRRRVSPLPHRTRSIHQSVRHSSLPRLRMARLM